jgi:hypothetical protein
MKSSNLSLRTPQAAGMTRVTVFTPSKVMRFTEERIISIDETGVSTVQTPMKIVAQRGTNQVERITSAERGKNITAVGTVSAAGTFIPPMTSVLGSR